jgi:hypothetical protein
MVPAMPTRTLKLLLAAHTVGWFAAILAGSAVGATAASVGVGVAVYGLEVGAGRRRMLRRR